MKKADVKGVIVGNDEKWIYDLFGIENCSPADVAAVLEAAAGEDVVVEINSGGGSVFAGSEIYSMLQRYGGKVVIDITGVAASAASVVAMASENRISRTGAIMIHNVSSYAEGDYRDMQKSAEALKTLNKTVAGAYKGKTGKDFDELLKMMNAETWLDAEKAVELGFVDGIYGQEKTAPKSPAAFAAAYGNGLLPSEVINKMQAKRAKAKAKIKLLEKTRR